LEIARKLKEPRRAAPLKYKSMLRQIKARSLGRLELLQWCV
jgi:hypothetical protein